VGFSGADATKHALQASCKNLDLLTGYTAQHKNLGLTYRQGRIKVTVTMHPAEFLRIGIIILHHRLNNTFLLNLPVCEISFF
jgi:hypothetical protein